MFSDLSVVLGKCKSEGKNQDSETAELLRKLN